MEPHGGEEATPKAAGHPPREQGPLGSAFQTNRRESFYQRDLEEKMVHKVTMDTVRIITSSVSGMTNVSGHPAADSLTCVGPTPGSEWRGQTGQ